MVFRAWKVPVGFVQEEVRLFGPSGRMVWRWGPEVRRMAGMFDLTTEVDEVADAVFDETGTFVASFILDEQILGEIEVPVYVQASPQKLPKDVEDGFRKSDVIWVGADVNGRRRTIPSWFAYKDGKIYVLSQREPGPEEQTVPGIGEAKEFVVVTRHKGRDTSIAELPAAGRILDGAEWEAAAKLLVDRRRSRVGPPADSLEPLARVGRHPRAHPDRAGDGLNGSSDRVGSGIPLGIARVGAVGPVPVDHRGDDDQRDRREGRDDRGRESRRCHRRTGRRTTRPGTRPRRRSGGRGRRSSSQPSCSRAVYRRKHLRR